MCLCYRPATFRSSVSRLRRGRQEDARKWQHSAAHTGAARTNHQYSTGDDWEAVMRLHRHKKWEGRVTPSPVCQTQEIMSDTMLLVCYRRYFFSVDCSIYRKGTHRPLVELIENCIMIFITFGMLLLQTFNTIAEIYQLTFHF